MKHLTLLSIVVLSVTSGSSAQPSVSWFTVDGGGNSNASASGSFEIAGTIGQADAQVPPVMAGGAFALTGGFWPVANVCYCLGDLNGDGKKNGEDIARFVGCIISGGSCSCADVNGANGVDLADMSVFVNDLLAGAACP